MRIGRYCLTSGPGTQWSLSLIELRKEKKRSKYLQMEALSLLARNRDLVYAWLALAFQLSKCLFSDGISQLLVHQTVISKLYLI